MITTPVGMYFVSVNFGGEFTFILLLSYYLLSILVQPAMPARMLMLLESEHDCFWDYCSRHG